MRRVFLTADAWLPKMTPTTKACALSLWRLHFVHSGSLCNFQLSMCSSVQRYSVIHFWLLWGWKRGSRQILAFAKNWTYRAPMEAEFVRSLLALIILNKMERSEDLYVTNTWASFIYKVQEKERQTWDCIAGSTKVAEYCEHLVWHTWNQPNQAPDSDLKMIDTLLENFKHSQKFSPELMIKLWGILNTSRLCQ